MRSTLEKQYDIKQESNLKAIEAKVVNADIYINKLASHTSSRAGKRLENEDYGRKLMMRKN